MTEMADPSPTTPPKPPSFLRRLWRGLQTFEEAFSRTEVDDLRDRIEALERRLNALTPPDPRP